MGAHTEDSKGVSEGKCLRKQEKGERKKEFVGRALDLDEKELRCKLQGTL